MIASDARRLLTILQALPKPSSGSGQSTLASWRDVLGPVDDEAELFRLFATVLEMVGRVEAAIDDLVLEEDTEADYRSAMGSVRKALSPAFNSTASVFTQNLRPEVLSEIKHLARDFERLEGTAAAVESASADSLAEDISNLIAEVREASLPADFGRRVVGHLLAVRFALQHIDVLGVERVWAHASALVGEVVLNADTHEAVKQSGLAHRIFTFVSRVADLTTLTQTLPQLADGAGQLLS